MVRYELTPTGSAPEKRTMSPHPLGVLIWPQHSGHDQFHLFLSFIVPLIKATFIAESKNKPQ